MEKLFDNDNKQIGGFNNSTEIELFTNITSRLGNIYEYLYDKLYVISLENIGEELLNELKTLQIKDDYYGIDMFFNFNNYPKIYKKEIEKTLEENEEFPFVFSFKTIDRAYNYIVAEEDSEYFKKGNMYRLYLADNAKLFWIAPEGFKPEEAMATLLHLELLSNTAISFPSLIENNEVDEEVKDIIVNKDNEE